MNDKKAKRALMILAPIMLIFGGIEYARGNMFYPMAVLILEGCTLAYLLLTRKKSA